MKTKENTESQFDTMMRLLVDLPGWMGGVLMETFNYFTSFWQGQGLIPARIYEWLNKESGKCVLAQAVKMACVHIHQSFRIVSKYEKPFFTFRRLNIHSGVVGQSQTTLIDAHNVSTIKTTEEFDNIFIDVYEGRHSGGRFCEITPRGRFGVLELLYSTLRDEVFGKGLKDPDLAVRLQATRMIKLIEEEQLEDGKTYYLFTRGVACGRTIWVKARQVQSIIPPNRKWLLDASYERMSVEDGAIFILPQPDLTRLDEKTEK